MIAKNIFSLCVQHYLFCLYLLVFAGLMLGLNSESGIEHVINLFVFFFIPFVISYILLFKVIKLKKLDRKVASRLQTEKAITFFNSKSKAIGIFFLVFSLVVFLMYPLFFGYFPGFTAFDKYNYYVLYEIRNSVTADVPVWFNYLTSFVIKAILPFSILYAYAKKQNKLLFALIIIAILFGINCMQKSYFMIFYLPLFLFLVYKKKWLHSFTLLGVMFLAIYSMVVVTNPEIKYSFCSSISNFFGFEYNVNKDEFREGSQWKQPNYDEKSISESNGLVVNSLVERTVFLPGKIVGKWLRIVPETKPFLGFGGNRWTALLFGEDYHEYSVELYPIVFPNYHKQGFTGTVNVAGFINNYACFGWLGVFVGAIVLAVIFVFITLSFENNSRLSFSINTMPILMLSSTGVSVLMFSGGWALSIFLSIFLLNRTSQGNVNE